MPRAIPDDGPAVPSARDCGSSRLEFAITLAIVCSLGPVAARAADSIEPGLWKVRSRPEVHGAPGPEQVKNRCLTPEEAANVEKTFSPEHRTVNAQCERVEHDFAAGKLRWRLKCSGQMAMDVAGAFEFHSPQHYTAVIASTAAIGGASMESRVTIEGDRIGECP